MGWLKDAAAGAVGGTAAGLLLSGAFLGFERLSGEPSELVVLGRKVAAALGSPYRYKPSEAAPEEQAMSHGGHLLLSACLGAAYPLVRRAPGLDGVAGGLAYGMVLYPLLWGFLGPALGLTGSARGEGVAVVARRFGMHAGFGVVTAWIANRLSPREGSRA
jgi:hypothetical protein